MKIGIDISQVAFEGTGVAEYAKSLVKGLLKLDKKNEYILFFSSLRRNFDPQMLNIKNLPSNLKVRVFKFPPLFLDFLWNRLHLAPIEWFIGKIDLFISSDWTEPPVVNAKKATILYDLIVYKYPKETDREIIATQKRKLNWVKKESKIVFCISKATKKDAIEILGIEEKRLQVIYPGISY